MNDTLKEPWEWDEEDLLGLIRSGVQESISLDYKGSDALPLQKADRDKRANELSKDVSAFANSAGGTIVYGIAEEGRLPVRIDAGIDPNQVSREWVEQIINSRIQRRIDGVRVKQILLTRTSPGKVAYVVCVPQSFRAPHQAWDKKFYKRFEFQSVAMEEYEVRDVAQRGLAPDIEVHFQLGDARLAFPEGEPYSVPIKVSLKVINRGPVAAEYAVFLIFIDERLKIVNAAGLSCTEVRGNIGPFTAICLQENWGIPAKIPIIEGLRLPLGSGPLELAFPSQDALPIYGLGWQVYSPRMTPKRGFVHLERMGSAVRIVDSSGILKASDKS